jgi:hypothetical protein
MKALALENELKELEKEKELQRELVQETVDRKSTGSFGSSSWETDSAADVEESDASRLSSARQKRVKATATAMDLFSYWQTI